MVKRQSETATARSECGLKINQAQSKPARLERRLGGGGVPKRALA